MAFFITFSTYNHIYVQFFAEFEYEIQHICYVPKEDWSTYPLSHATLYNFIFTQV